MKKTILCLIVLCLAGNIYGQDSTTVFSEERIQQLESAWKSLHYQFLLKKEENQKLKNWRKQFFEEFGVFLQALEMTTAVDTVLVRIVPEQLRDRSNIWLWYQEYKKRQSSQR